MQLKLPTQLGFLLSLVIAMPMQAQTVESIQNVQIESLRNDRESQKRIDGLDDESRELLAEYRQVSHQLRQLRRYDNQLERLITSQEKSLLDLEAQRQQLAQTKQEILPLMQRMVAGLKSFIALDLPFLQEERNLRVENLQAMMDQADTTLPEKFRRLMEALQVEMDYGRTIGAYEDDISLDGKDIKVEILRVGRIGLYFMTLDSQSVGHFDLELKLWRYLPKDYLADIRRSFQVARKQVPPEILSLPLTMVKEKRSTE